MLHPDSESWKRIHFSSAHHVRLRESLFSDVTMTTLKLFNMFIFTFNKSEGVEHYVSIIVQLCKGMVNGQSFD